MSVKSQIAQHTKRDCPARISALRRQVHLRKRRHTFRSSTVKIAHLQCVLDLCWIGTIPANRALEKTFAVLAKANDCQSSGFEVVAQRCFDLGLAFSGCYNEIVTVTRGACHMACMVLRAQEHSTLRPPSLCKAFECVLAQSFEALREKYNAVLCKRPRPVRTIPDGGMSTRCCDITQRNVPVFGCSTAGCHWQQVRTQRQLVDVPANT